jgi:hypothetical protein
LYITALAAVSWLSVLGLRETHETTLQAPQARN